MSKIILVTGGAGFIGSALVRFLLSETENQVINLDCLTYAANLESIPNSIIKKHRYFFEEVNICNKNRLKEVFLKYEPDYVMHLAAESHVDRSIANPDQFIQTNIIGTYNLLECAQRQWSQFGKIDKKKHRFHHISTDEVFGELDNKEPSFNENSPYKPNSPYSASKAGSDFLVRAWGKTYDLPYVISNCSNNYGPYQFPEKLIPLMLIKAIMGEDLPVYGNGNQIRDWLHVDDHVRAMYKVLTEANNSQTFNIGANNELQNIQVVKKICHILDELIQTKPKNIKKFSELIKFVDDRPGHDFRYAIDNRKIKQDLEWEPKETFDSGLKKTIIWYLDNRNWWEGILDNSSNIKNNGEFS